MAKTKNDNNWEEIFSEHKILEYLQWNNLYYITAEEINKKREARLMTKFDFQNNLPNVFLENGLGILPTKRGEYCIGRFNLFGEIKRSEIEEIKPLSMPKPWFIESIDFEKITSESVMIQSAYLSEMFSHFLELERTNSIYPTISGRMGTGAFDFYINANRIFVDKVQIEIDASFETQNEFIIVEAKNFLNESVLIRQLYFPYKEFLEVKKINKKIRLILLTFSNGIYTFQEYTFLDSKNYNSLYLLKCQRYKIIDRANEKQINIEFLKEIMAKPLNNILSCRLSILSHLYKPITFPQADSFERILDILEYLKENGEIKNRELNRVLDVDKGMNQRQVNYYLSALKIFGLVNTDIWGKTSLNEKGLEYFKKSFNERIAYLIERILTLPVFHEMMEYYLIYNDFFDKQYCVNLFEEYGLLDHYGNPFSKVTMGRRYSTVKGWIKWVFNQLED